MSTPDNTKLVSAIQKILASPEATQTLFAELEKADFHVLRGMRHMFVSHPDREANARTAIVLDTETTGLDNTKDEIIQLSMLKIKYDDDGIVSITEDFFDQLQDPGVPLSEEIQRLTGFTDADLKDQKIDLDAAAAFMKDVDLIIAHNASFDRKFVEKKFPSLGFDKIDWACSIKDVKWDKRVTGSAKLELLALHAGYVYPAHNAKADCTATAFVLSQTYNGETEVMTDIVASRKTQKVMILGVGIPFERKDVVKEAGFRWCGETTGEAGEKCWYKTVGTPEEAQEAADALRQAFGGDVRLPVRRYTAKNAYSDRLPPKEINGFEVKNPLKALGLEDLAPAKDEQISFGL